MTIRMQQPCYSTASGRGYPCDGEISTGQIFDGQNEHGVPYIAVQYSGMTRAEITEAVGARCRLNGWGDRAVYGAMTRVVDPNRSADAMRVITVPVYLFRCAW